MAAPSRPPIGLSSRKNSMRPPPTRPMNSRAQSSAPSLPARSQSGTISPTNSVVSMSTSRSRSPTHAKGTKRKERDFDTEGEETNIHVVVRCRGRSDREVRENSGVVVSTTGAKGKSVELSMGPSALSNKTYHFDKVFSPAADQSMIYEDVVTPLLDEMLQGYNCTIFAYGQTGTGKTYTMSGDMLDTAGLLSDSAGIIPRVLHSLFAKLEGEEAESSVKCSFIELYNEELRDLLSPDDHTKLKIYEDGVKKGHAATIIQGMEESHIKTAGAGIKLLQDGSHKRQVAATKCNDLSSRSHTVFTVTVYLKRTSETGEDYVSAGKLNLVDLAGSENIQRSGAENKRAAEAGLINKSLLTLGRVINALVDRSSHIPYRESKLTRLLQDSLGGRTKTCIIATVSPAKSNLEETISTLDYAFRAKNIRNKPQINQMISKKTLLREFTAEIEKLKAELIAARQRNGVYLTNEIYEEITVESESRRILSEEQQAKIETIETHLRNKTQELFALTNNFAILKKDNESTRLELDNTNGVLEKTEIVLADTKQNLADEAFLRRAHQTTENRLLDAGGKLLSTIGKTVHDVEGLHAKIARKSVLQTTNRSNWESAQSQVSDITKVVESRINVFQGHHIQLLTTMSTHMQQFISKELARMKTEQMALKDRASAFEISHSNVLDQTTTAKDEMNGVLEEIKVLREDVKQKVGEGLEGLSAAAGRISAGVINELEGFHNQLHTSYSSLGRDFKSIFEELVKHLNSQKAEADELRHKLSEATTALVQSNVEVSNKLEECVAEERRLATDDRQKLLSQITSLLNDAGQKQDTRWNTRISTARNAIANSQSDFIAAERQYSECMDVWSQKENVLVEEVLKSRENLKSKMKRDWTSINDHNASIQRTTKSVHEETVCIVDAQMKDMATQMQALDDFVTRARTQNEAHHESHIQSLEPLGSSVKDSYSSHDSAITAAHNRISQLGTDMSSQTTFLQSTLPPLTTDICNPLSSLRETISKTELMEYTPTGDTPQKTLYSYPSTLPRTEPYQKLLATLTNARTPTAFSSSAVPPSLAPPSSPSKQPVYNDARPTLPDEVVSLLRPTSLDHPLSTSSSSDAGGGGGGSSSRPSTATSTSTNSNNTSGLLREVHPNIPSSSSATTTTTTTSSHTKPDISELLHMSMGTGPSTRGVGGSYIAPPPLKRLATTMETTKLPRGTTTKGRAVVVAEGRENQAEVVMGVGRARGGGGRRLRSAGSD